MTFSTISVSSAIAPTVVKTWFKHNFGERPPKQSPSHNLSYHEGVEIIRRFMAYSSHQTVEEVQAFTARHVPSPHWVKQSHIVIPADHLVSAGNLIIAELGSEGIDRVGGEKWWQWRGDEVALAAEWIEMRSDYTQRKNLGQKSQRVMLYVHGGAFFFGSVDTHRYQLQRHARKLKARLLAPRFRLAPQFPFPCGLQDCLASYLYLLTIHKPEEIILAGDSSGGGMVASLLIILRDQKMPLPAGAILISPWLDLTHSFPSMNDSGDEDYLPKYGFMQKPSMSWPPPNIDEIGVVTNCAGRILQAINSPPVADSTTSVDVHAIEQFFLRQATATSHAGHLEALSEHHNPGRQPHPDHQLSVRLDGVMVELKDQIHMYATNDMLSHPLVSPVLQPSLGGLPPLLVLAGGGEMLRDEQIYFAHKAANPTAYLPSEKLLDRHDPERRIIGHYRPTNVHLQVWEHLCHVAPTLSFTQPAKYMYRSIAQFGAWALSHAQEASIDIPDWSSTSSGDVGYSDGQRSATSQPPQGFKSVGKAGDPLPPFRRHMIRQLIDGHGNIHPLPDESELQALHLSPDDIGEPKAGPVRRWMTAKQEWDTKYARLKSKILKKRVEELLVGIKELAPGETPPPTSNAARRGVSIQQIRKPTRKSRALSFWNSIGNRHDEYALRESGEYAGRLKPPMPRPASETRVVTDIGQLSDSERNILEKHSTPGEASRTSSRYDEKQGWGPGNSANGQINHHADETPVEAGPVQHTPIIAADRESPSGDYVPPRSPLRGTRLGRELSLRSRRPDDRASARAVRHAQGVIAPVSPGQKSGSSGGWETPSESLSTEQVPGISAEPPADISMTGGIGMPANPRLQVETPGGGLVSEDQSQPRPLYDFDNPTPVPVARSPASTHLSARPGSFVTARGSTKRYYHGKELADEFNSTGAIDPSEIEPFPSLPGSGNWSSPARSRHEVNGSAEKLDIASEYSGGISDDAKEPKWGRP